MKYKESETVELKKSTSELKEAIIAIAAILNKHNKGRLYFGIRNDGMVIGQDIGRNTIREVSQAITDNIEPRIFPSITARKMKGKICLTVIFSGSVAPYFAYGRAYMRVGDENKQLSARELERLFLMRQRETAHWEAQPSNKKISEINVKVLKNYIVRANHAGRINFKFDNVKNVLRKLGLLNGPKLLNAAEVLFCNRNPLKVQAAVFAGKDKLTFLDINKSEGNIFELLDKSEKYINQRINWRVQFGRLEREEVPEVPTKAVREALVNSVCHRDYTNAKENEIAIFKDRIEIYNPGDFPQGYTPQDFIKGKERSMPRNPLIAETLYKSREIEKWGSGLKRIYDECKASKVRVDFEVLKSGFLVIFYRPGEKVTKGLVEGLVERLGERLGEKLGVNESKIITLLIGDKFITITDIAKRLRISTTAVEKNLAKLKEKDLLRRIGPDKGGHWEVIEKSK